MQNPGKITKKEGGRKYVQNKNNILRPSVFTACIISLF